VRGYWYHRRIRGLAWQALAIGGALSLGVYLITNLIGNLEHQGIASGFDFLDTAAGFGITMSLIEYSEQSSYARAFVVGLLNTILVSVLGVACATVLGFAVGLGRLSSNWLVARLSQVYVETIRNIPLLLQIFFWYFLALNMLPGPRQSYALGEMIFLNNRGLYVPGLVFESAGGWAAVGFALWLIVFLAVRRAAGTSRCLSLVPWAAGAALALSLVIGIPTSATVPELRGFNFQGGWVLIPELVALLAALSIYTAAFIAEIVRAGIEAVPRGQVEAAHALGLDWRDILRRIVIPQALRVIIPPLTNQYLNLTKNSSLAAAIAYPDLVSVFAGTVLNQTGQAVEVIAVTMAVYLVLSLTISALMNVYHWRLARQGG
jgi:general L-amino acid transport system permease protein